MEEVKVTWYGHAMFHVENPRVKLVTDPFDKAVGYPLPGVEADAVLVSHDHFDHNNVSLVKNARHVVRETEPLLIGPVKIEGCRSYHDEVKGQQRGENLIFKWQMSGITFVHMGDYGEDALSLEQVEFLSGADILMLPVGGVYTIDGHKAREIVEAVKPSAVIPMHYKTKRCLIDLNDAGEFVSFFEHTAFCGSSVVVSSANFPSPTEVWVLEPAS